MPVLLLCPKCNRPFAEEPNPKRMDKTIENVKTICAEKKWLGVPKRKLMCAFCGHKFNIDDARVRE